MKRNMVEETCMEQCSKSESSKFSNNAHPHTTKAIFYQEHFLMKSGLKTLNTARQNSSRAAVSVNTARPINTAYPRPTVNCARPVSNVFNRAHSHVRSPFNKFTTNKNSNFNKKVNTVRGNITSVGPKAVGDIHNQVLKIEEVLTVMPRHMTGNRSSLTDNEENDEEFVCLWREVPREGKITRKVNIRTGRIGYKEVYF
ncbi:hypothetical protein Tco_0448726 [Tanacetum coccineum]